MLRTKKLQYHTFDTVDPWSGLLASVAWDNCSTYHTTRQASSAILVFSRDMLLNVKFIADWEAIRLRKQSIINKNNHRDNNLWVDYYDYQVGDQVLITSKYITRKLNCPTKGPFKIIQVYTNGTVRVPVPYRMVQYLKQSISDAAFPTPHSTIWWVPTVEARSVRIK